MKKARFHIDPYMEVYEGYTSGQRWNGWEMPYLSKPEVLRLIEHLNDNGATTFCWDGENLIETDNDDKCSDIVPTMDIGGETYYRVGNGWIWEAITT